VTYLHVGGVVAMGFDPGGRFLLVVSHSGRGVFSLGSWERVARDATTVYPKDGFIDGIGPIANTRIAVEQRDQNKEQIRLRTPDGRFLLRGESDGIAIEAAE